MDTTRGDNRPTRPVGQFLLGLMLPYPFLLVGAGLVAVIERANGPDRSYGWLDALVIAVSLVLAIWVLARQRKRKRWPLIAGGVIGLVLSPAVAWFFLMVYLVIGLPSRLAG